MKIWKKIFGKKEKTENRTIPEIESKMKYIYDAINNHLKMETTGALLLTGDWGSGKTYHVKNHIFPKIENDTDFIPLIVSLYGVTNKNDIAQRVLFAYFDKKGKDSNISTSNIAKNLKNFTDAIPIVKKYVNIEKLITGTGDNLFRLLPHDKLLICFDDLERISDSVKVKDFLGIVNELVENKGSKVLIIANEPKIENGNGISFKEKTIEKTIHFTPNISAIFDSIISTYSNDEFKNYLNNNKDYILKTLDTTSLNGDDAKELEKLFSNIRTLKFTIEHFKYPFLIINEEKEITEELVLNQLKNIWVFILSISTEFRKPNNITFNVRKNLDNQTSSFSDIDFSGFGLESDSQNENEVQEENEWTYSEKFKEIYFNRLSEQYIFHPEIYDLITSSKEIDKALFLENIEKSFNVSEGKIHPAHEMLNSFMQGYWNLSDEEFKINLQQLLDFAENGELLDIVSYLNAGVYLLNFVDFFNSSKEVVYEKLKSGLDIFLRKGTFTRNMLTQVNMVQGSFKEENLQNLISFIKEEIKKLEKENDKEEAERLSDLIMSDVSAFVQEFLPDNINFRSPDKAIFHELDEEKVKSSVALWKNSGIMDISSFLKIRYLDTSFSDRLVDELKFLETLEEGIKLIKMEDKILSNHLIKTQLLPRIVECKMRLGQKNAL